MALGDGDGWDETGPAAGDDISDGAAEIRDLRKGVKIRLDKEHGAFAVSSAGGKHESGSAKIYYASTAPTKQPDGTTDLDGSTDAGRLWYDSTNGQLKIINQTTPGVGWTVIA